MCYICACAVAKRRQQWQKYSVLSGHAFKFLAYSNSFSTHFGVLSIRFFYCCLAYVCKCIVCMSFCVLACVSLKSQNVYICVFLLLTLATLLHMFLYDGNKIWNLDYNHSNTLSSIVSEKPHFDSRILTTVDKRHKWRVQSKWPWLATNWKIYCHLSLVWEEIPSFSSPFFHSQLHMSVDCVQNQMQLLSQKSDSNHSWRAV